jgi:hypothetical protein
MTIKTTITHKEEKTETPKRYWYYDDDAKRMVTGKTVARIDGDDIHFTDGAILQLEAATDSYSAHVEYTVPANTISDAEQE